MIGKVRLRAFLMCPMCEVGELEATHIVAGQSFGPWCCPKCGKYFQGKREGVLFTLEPMPEITREKITVTLRSQTTPPITLKLNTWQYTGLDAAGKEVSPETAWAQCMYFFNVHTCPTNYMSEVAEIEFEGSPDPHGVFEFVSMEFGHVGEEKSH